MPQPLQIAKLKPGISNVIDPAYLPAVLLWTISLGMMALSAFTTCKSPAAPIFDNPVDISTYTNSIGMKFVYIPAGSFRMGTPESEKDSDSNERPVHTVHISKPFHLGMYEVTQAQWDTLMGGNPSYFNGPNLPVEQVLWNGCQEFIRLLNTREGGDYYRLPTEAEWEYACRAGSTGAYAGSLDAMGWYDSNSGNQTHPVGQKKPNSWGLYDMHGNVWEWCQDGYGSYPSGTVTDPVGASSGFTRVFRGGGWYDYASGCRSADRGNDWPFVGHIYLGFRLVRTIAP